MKTTDNKPDWLKLLLFLPALFYLPSILGLIPFPGQGTEFSDMLITHYSYAVYLRQSIIQTGSIPLWSSFIYSGLPLAANPLAGLWYIPGWIALMLPLPEGLSFVMALHSLFGTWGMYFLLRNKGFSIQSSILGGVSFGLLPKSLQHFSAGHVTLLYAISWTPWLFLVSESDRKGWKTGLIASLLFLADPRWAAIVGGFWATHDIARRYKAGVGAIFFYLRSSLIAFLLASPLIIPMVEFLLRSTRLQLTPSESMIFSFPPTNLLGLIIPANSGIHEWFSYLGGILLVLSILSITDQSLRKRSRFWMIWIVISILMAFGSYVPGWEFISRLPFLRLMRVPARALFLTEFCVIMIAAYAIEEYQNNQLSENLVRRAGFGLLTFFIFLGAGLVFLHPEVNTRLLWGVCFAAVGSLIIFMSASNHNKQVWGWILIGLLVMDLFGSGLLNTAYRNKQGLTETNQQVLTILDLDQEFYRVYSPSFSFPQYLAVQHGIDLADGIDPFQLKSYAEYMEAATGVPNLGYTVTIPSFATGDPKLDNRDVVPNLTLLGLINVKYIMSSSRIESDGLRLLGKYSGDYLYLNQEYFPRSWLQPGDVLEQELTATNRIQSVENLEIKPNRIKIQASGPGKLVLAELDYPGWIARVDGELSQITPVYEILRSVEMPAGKHEVEFLYRPMSVYLGLCLAAVGWGYCAWQLISERK